jgi:multiple sugar transport system substrate-binding protein
MGASYTARRGNIQVQFEATAGTYEEKILTQHLAGDAPHLLNARDEPFPRLASSGVYQDLTQLARRDAKDMRLEDLWPKWLDVFRLDEALQRPNLPTGKLYGLPWGGSVSLWLYNKDAFDKLGVPHPKQDWTWDDFVGTSTRLTRRAGDGTAQQLAFIWPAAQELMAFVWTLGEGYLFLDDTYKKCELNKPGSQFAHEQLWRLANDWKVARLSADFQGVPDPWQDGQVAMRIAGPAHIHALRQQQKGGGWANWDVAPMWTYKGKRAARQTPDGITNWSGTKHPEEGWDFIRYITGEEGQKAIAEDGRGMPARISLARSASFVWPTSPQHEEYFLDAMQYAQLQPVTRYWDEMLKIINKHYGDMVDPKQQLRPAAFLEQLARDTTTLLQTGTLPTGY